MRALLDADLIREIGLQTTGTGRPAIMLELNPDAGCIISAEIGVDFIGVIRANFTSQIQWRCREAITELPTPSQITARLIHLIKQAIQLTHGNQLQAARLLGISRLTLREKLTQLGLRPGQQDEGRAHSHARRLAPTV